MGVVSFLCSANQHLRNVFPCLVPTFALPAQENRRARDAAGVVVTVKRSFQPGSTLRSTHACMYCKFLVVVWLTSTILQGGDHQKVHGLRNAVIWNSNAHAVIDVLMCLLIASREYCGFPPSCRLLSNYQYCSSYLEKATPMLNDCSPAKDGQLRRLILAIQVVD